MSITVDLVLLLADIAGTPLELLAPPRVSGWAEDILGHRSHFRFTPP